MDICSHSFLQHEDKNWTTSSVLQVTQRATPRRRWDTSSRRVWPRWGRCCVTCCCHTWWAHTHTHTHFTMNHSRLLWLLNQIKMFMFFWLNVFHLTDKICPSTNVSVTDATNTRSLINYSYRSDLLCNKTVSDLLTSSTLCRILLVFTWTEVKRMTWRSLSSSSAPQVSKLKVSFSSMLTVSLWIGWS